MSDLNPAAADLASKLRSSEVLAQLLLNRGFSDPHDCLQFLKPDLKCLHDPSLMPNLPAAAERIAKAIRDKEKIVIYGDYDVDGITGVAIMWHAIRTLGGQVEYYIPHRIDEGYGLNSEAIAQICDNGAKLIVSVDCGVTAIEPAKVARNRGVDLIITDHHEFKGHDEESKTQQDGPVLPDALAIVHPRLNKPYPNLSICGAGVAFKLAWGVGLVMSGGNRVSNSMRDFLVDALALAALGTIADVVPLVDENRVLAHYGLMGLKTSRLNGIRSLIRSAGLDGQKLDCYHAGFVLAPRLNAAGRMGHANLAAELLTTADAARSDEVAVYLDEQNRSRQAIERKTLEQALEQVEQTGYASDKYRAIVLAGEGWHAGVIGIVASRMVDRFHKPTIMVALNNGWGQGSGRSINGFHLARALQACGQHLESHGGHEMAAGLKVRNENFEPFRNAFIEHANQTIQPAMLVPELKIDCVADLAHMSEALVNELKRLGPFGHGNRRPVLCCRGLTLAGSPRRVGKTGDHLQLFVRQGRNHMKCIAFGAGKMFDKLREGMNIDLAVEPQINEFNGRISIELAVKDVQIPR
ncbi:MAG TPA: single-stranded-DNA-specific exonuclease RecJ [Tepidisphaeraceae bacterium]|nr:single-stranded-DNA-specific exonuclease RecJ [Tepidisphaeraceae bacterium]